MFSLQLKLKENDLDDEHIAELVAAVMPTLSNLPKIYKLETSYRIVLAASHMKVHCGQLQNNYSLL